MCEQFIGICKLCFIDMAKFCGYEIFIYEKFCWVCDVDYWKIHVVMILAMQEFICACTCGNFYLGHVGIFSFSMAMEKFGSCV